MLSSDDPVRVFQRYSTLDGVSGGRAEVILGRGSSIESFPLFGYDLAEYEHLFDEKTNLFAELMKGGPVTWNGATRAALHEQEVVPHLEDGPVPGLDRRRREPRVGDPRRALRLLAHARDHRRPPARFAPFSQLFREALEQFGQPPRPIGMHSPGHIADTDEEAREESGPTGSRRSRASSQERGFRLRPRRRSSMNRARRRALRRLPRDRRQEDRGTSRELGANRFDLKFGMPETRPRTPHDDGRALRHPGHTRGYGNASATARSLRQPVTESTR